jgi:hypothetical protein
MPQEPVYVYNFGNDVIGESTITVQRNNSIQIRDQSGVDIVLPIDEDIDYEELSATTYVIKGKIIYINNIVNTNILKILQDNDRATIEFGLETNEGLQHGTVTVQVPREATEKLLEIAIALRERDNMPGGYQPLAGKPVNGQEGGTRYRRKTRKARAGQLKATSILRRKTRAGQLKATSILRRKTRKLKRKGLKK